jgi:hypothetical protein
MYKMRSFHYCNAALDLILKYKKQKDMTFEVHSFIHLVFTTQNQGKIFYINISVHSFPVTAATFIWRQSFSILSVGRHNPNSSACSCNSKWRDSSWRLWNQTQTRQDISESATAHNKTCLDVHWISWRMLWVSVVNCGLIKSKDTRAMELGMFAVDVLSLLYIKLYMVKILDFACNHKI